MKLSKTTKMIFMTAILMFAATVSNASAQNQTAAVGAGCEKILRGAEVLYFPTRDVAVVMYNAHLKQGDCAKLWNAGGKGWALQVKAVPGANSRRGKISGGTSAVTSGKTKTATSGRTTTTSGNSGNSVAVGAGCTQALRTAKIVYYPSTMKSMAEDMYNAHLRQGDCAKLWFDSGRNQWALAVKAIPGAGSRKGVIRRRN